MLYEISNPDLFLNWINKFIEKFDVIVLSSKNIHNYPEDESVEYWSSLIYSLVSGSVRSFIRNMCSLTVDLIFLLNFIQRVLPNYFIENQELNARFSEIFNTLDNICQVLYSLSHILQNSFQGYSDKGKLNYIGNCLAGSQFIDLLIVHLFVHKKTILQNSQNFSFERVS